MGDLVPEKALLKEYNLSTELKLLSFLIVFQEPIEKGVSLLGLPWRHPGDNVAE